MKSRDISLFQCKITFVNGYRSLWGRLEERFTVLQGFFSRRPGPFISQSTVSKSVNYLNSRNWVTFQFVSSGFWLQDLHIFLLQKWSSVFIDCPSIKYLWWQAIAKDPIGQNTAITILFLLPVLFSVSTLSLMV